MKIWCCTYLPRHFCAWALSTDTIQILHAIWIRDKVQMLVLNEKVCTPKPPWLVCRDQVYSAVICHPRGSLQTAHRCGCLHPFMPVKMAGVLFSKESGLLTIPSLKEPRNCHSFMWKAWDGSFTWLSYHIKSCIKSHHRWWLEVHRAAMCIWTYVLLIYF